MAERSTVSWYSLSKFWDLKTLAFQAKTSSTSEAARRSVMPRDSGACVSPGPKEGDSPAAPELAPPCLWSGFQPTVEPTAFQAVVVQLCNNAPSEVISAG